MEIKTTQRAYTLRLRGADPNDRAWRDNLWKTHDAVNKGAKVFGEWLLTLRGGLDHKLADTKDKRIVLALSWLSVESWHDAPPAYVVPHDIDIKTGKINWKLKEAFCNMLQGRGVGDDAVNQWWNDCKDSLSAAIKDEGVWVNRSKAFDNAVKKLNGSLRQDEIWDMLEPFFGSSQKYLAPVKTSEAGEDESSDEGEAKDLVQKAGQWLSSRFGTGKGADFGKLASVCEAIASSVKKANHGKPGRTILAEIIQELSYYKPCSNDLQGIQSLLSYAGSKEGNSNLLDKLDSDSIITKEMLEDIFERAKKQAQKHRSKTGKKGQRDYANVILQEVEQGCGFTYHNDSARHVEFSVMLDHAARRVSSVHTWIKRAEAERRRFEEDAKKIGNVPKEAKEWLDRFREDRSFESGSLEGYRIRKRAAEGWKEVVKAWGKCQTEDERISSARALQDNPDIDKFGDIQLFEALASEKALCVWQSGPQTLNDYVAATDAEFKMRHFKVPAYCHPDPLLHPIFCDFGNSRWSINFDVHDAYKNKDKKRKSMAVSTNVRGLQMKLYTGNTVKEIPLRWQSKKLVQDLALCDLPKDNAADVSRADRLGRAAGKAKGNSVTIKGVFDQSDWNGRLQAPRAQLEAIAKVRDNIKRSSEEKKRRMDKLVSNIKWFVTFSPKLQPQGPWFDFIKNSKDAAFERVYKSGAKKGQAYISYGFPHEKENNVRSGMANLNLSRIPGLRFLSVDLGHRYAAACAVWETLSKALMEDECRASGVSLPTEKEIYRLLKSKAENGKVKTAVYRRIGADTLPDGSQHPAPWARLDRQFLIKLQGEERDARKASLAERETMNKLEDELGFIASDERSLQVDDLMSDAVNTIRLALRRHSDAARIAYSLITDERTRPGGIKERLEDNGRVEMITDALEFWHSLATSKRWQDTAAEDLWKQYVPDVRLSKIDDEEKTRQQIKKEKKDFRQQTLRAIAEKLAKNKSLCMKLSAPWATRWREDDGNWRKCLRRFSDWILPRGDRATGKAIRNVGGLSLTRIATIRSLHQVQKAFYTRLKPDGTHDTAKNNFGKSAIDALENMREQRVKQLASRIAEAGLGIGRIKIPKKGKDPKRPCEQVDRQCHAIVIENLTHYRPEETRTRRENRQLMQWSSAKVKKYLLEACQLHGLHLREVAAGYTSRQDSRTGAPGVRCTDVSVNDFLNLAFWIKEVKRAEDKLKENKGDAYERYILDLSKKWANASDEDKKKTVRIPRKGGEIFVSADGKSPAAKGIQADLNASANIGLKAIIDPDWPGRWWYVPCDSKGAPVKDKVSGSKALDNVETLRKAIADGEDTTIKVKKKRTKDDKSEKAKDIINLWRDVSSNPLTEGNWQEFTPYWKWVNKRVIEKL